MGTRQSMWMVRAGEAGFRFEDFKSANRVSVGWVEVGDMGSLRTRDEFTRVVEAAYPGQKKAQVAVAAGQLFRFVLTVATRNSWPA